MNDLPPMGFQNNATPLPLKDSDEGTLLAIISLLSRDRARDSRLMMASSVPSSLSLSGSGVALFWKPIGGRSFISCGPSYCAACATWFAKAKRRFASLSAGRGVSTSPAAAISIGIYL